ncbi:MAG: sigma 54-interacting transcriptional regulator [Halanaerobiales bacterium]|nr:sigma 54-interacting transcriptional regulator [Halanaerobiales bacterium]
MNSKWLESDKLLDNKSLCKLLNNLTEGIHVVDNKGKTILYNKKASEIDGLKPKEVLGKNIFEVFPSLTLETSTLMKTLKSGEKYLNHKQTFINYRGKKITTINHTFPITFKDETKGAVEISKDITQTEELVDDITNLRNKLKDNKKQKNKKGIVDNNTSYEFSDIIGQNREFNSSVSDAMKSAQSDSSVLIYGETGTGKELFAQSIHNASNRKNNEFIAQNCAALPKDLLESLLFGTEKGSFTGAKSKPGLFEMADGGTILLDEINSMDLSLQAKLLRVLQDGRVRRIGAQKEKQVDVRIITTMNMHPDKAFEKNLLREDLYYRLSVVYIYLPPLRKRKDDIFLLTDHFIEQYNKKFDKNITGLSNKLKDVFKKYPWPGNVRELKHVIESAYNIKQLGEKIKIDDLPGYIRERLGRNRNIINNWTAEVRIKDNEDLPSLESYLEEIEVKLIENALEKTNDNISAAARKLEISRQSLQYKLKKYDLK